MKLLEKHKIRGAIVFLMIAAVTICSGNFQHIEVKAYEQKTGMIDTDRSMVDTYEKASSKSTRCNGLVHGKPVTVVGEETGDDGLLWYKITYTLKKTGASRTAYCHASDVLLDENCIVSAMGTINANNVFVRNDAGTSGTHMLLTLDNGDQVEILDQTHVGTSIWYRVRTKQNGTAVIGWVYGSYITVGEYVVEPDPEFEAAMLQLGFPKSYINGLTALHARHPKWQFVPVLTGLDWNEVIRNESKAGINLVPITVDDAKKSVANTEYNWKTNEWVIRDSNRWVTAHPDYIAYCMDPRNFLNEEHVFQFESLSYNPCQNREGIVSVLGNSFMKNDVKDSDGSTLNYANAFERIGKELNVSPYHLASRVRQEQGRGNSPLISGTYPGFENYYNYFNFGAYGTPTEVLITRGLTYAKNNGWNTRYKSLYGGSQKLAKNYIGKKQDTLYFQKFNVVNKENLYGHQYMGNVTAAITEGASVGRGYSDKNPSFVFKIPVYNNMPEKMVSFTAKGNRNNYLKNLSVKGHSLTPTFSGDITEYSVIVDANVSSVDVQAEAVVQEAKVSGLGTYALQTGDNIIKIYCKSESGDFRTYTITVFKQGSDGGDQKPENPDDGDQKPENPDDGDQEPEQPDGGDQEPEKDPVLSSDVYKIDEYISAVNPETSASELKDKIACENGTIKLFDGSGKENTGILKTGDYIEVYDLNGNKKQQKKIVVYGDVNGDGKISMGDLVKINRHLLELSKLDGAYLEAGDVNHKNDGVTMSDLVITNRHLLELTTIKQ